MKYFTAPPSSFRPVPGVPRYFVSEEGEVWGPRGKMTPTPDRDGYLRVMIRVPGMRFVHKLVARAFLPAPVGLLPTVDHIDGDPRNNKASNLRWLSRIENVRVGHIRAGRRLSPKTVALVRELADKGVRYADIALAVGRAIPTVWKIAHGLRYEDCPGAGTARRHNCGS